MPKLKTLKSISSEIDFAGLDFAGLVTLFAGQTIGVLDEYKGIVTVRLQWLKLIHDKYIISFKKVSSKRKLLRICMKAWFVVSWHFYGSMVYTGP